MKVMRSIQTAVVAAAVVMLAGASNAAPISFVIDSGTSSIAIDISTQSLGGSQGSASASGSIDVDLTGGVLTTTGSSIDVADITTTGSGLLGTLIIAGAHAQLDDAGNPSVGVGDVYDLVNWELSLDQGVVFVPALGITAFDFSTGALALALPTVLSTLDDTGALATWEIPVNAVVTFFTLGNTVTVTVSGALNLVEIPEPGTLLLLGAGLAGLVMTGRRRA